jgi:hypothetical protein
MGKSDHLLANIQNSINGSKVVIELILLCWDALANVFKGYLVKYSVMNSGYVFKASISPVKLDSYFRNVMIF